MAPLRIVDHLGAQMGEGLEGDPAEHFSALAFPIRFPSTWGHRSRRLEHKAENIRPDAVADHLDQVGAACKIQVCLTPFDFYLLS